MLKLSLISGLMVAALSVAGCDRRPAEPQVPKAEIGQAPHAVLPDRPASDPSLPSATVALGRTDDKAPVAPPATLHTAPLSQTSESAAMPLGGQNNDHSAPKITDPVQPSSPPPR